MAPVPPTLISCGSMEKPNVMTVAWTGILNTKPPKTYISVRPERYSHPLITESGEFVINLTTEKLVKAADFCGVRSGRNYDKFALCDLHPQASSRVSAPSIEESPLSLECKVTDRISLGSHDMFLADIVAVDVDPKYVDEKGALHMEKAGLLAYAHGAYFGLGKQLGTFGFSVRKKPLKKSRKPAKKK